MRVFTYCLLTIAAAPLFHAQTTASKYNIATFAGTGVTGYSGDAGAATSAQLSNPSGVALNASGTLYIADQLNQRIRQVASGTISTIAGNGTAGYTGNGAAATSAELNDPCCIAVD